MFQMLRGAKVTLEDRHALPMSSLPAPLIGRFGQATQEDGSLPSLWQASLTVNSNSTGRAWMLPWHLYWACQFKFIGPYHGLPPCKIPTRMDLANIIDATNVEIHILNVKILFIS
jgi:hypothetical protein